MNSAIKLLRFLHRGVSRFLHRLRTQGLRLTLTWLYGRGTPIITGIPIMKYSRITPEIYVGPQYREVGKRRLEQLGITGSVNLRSEFDDRIHGLALQEYCYIPIINDHAPTLEQLNQGIAFVRRIIAERGKVYIHCRSGLGRAPTMAAAYFISQGFTISEAVRLIQQVRPFIEIKPTQMEQLKHFEAMQLGNHQS